MSSEHFIIVTIDGGAASGKSTTARHLAENLNWLHVDTGAHYRAITKAMIDRNVSADNKDQINNFLNNTTLGAEIDNLYSVIKINNSSFSHDELRAGDINENVSKYSAVPEIRNTLLKYQREQIDLAKEKGFSGIVMEGRDIGSVVLPNAPFRFFLKADAATRSSRRAAEGVSDSIQERDRKDSQRKTAPLICPSGATMINTSHTSLENVIGQIKQLINSRN